MHTIRVMYMKSHRLTLLVVLVLLCADSFFALPSHDDPDAFSKWIFRIFNGKGSGTAFLLRTTGETGFRAFITCVHVLVPFEGPNLVLLLHNESTIIVSHHSILPSSEMDIAVVYVPRAELPPTITDQDGFEVGVSAKFRTGSSIWTWGFPGHWPGRTPLFFEGAIGHTAPWWNTATKREVRRFVINVDIHHGHSGGPIVPTFAPHCAIGVASKKHKDLHPAIRTNKKRLEAYRLPDGSWQLPLEQTVLVDDGPLNFNSILADSVHELVKNAHLGTGEADAWDSAWVSMLMTAHICGYPPLPSLKPVSC